MAIRICADTGKMLLEAAMDPEVREIVLVNCCDVVRRLYDILKKQPPPDFLYLLDLPHKSGEAERRRFAEQLRRLTGRYESFSGRPFSWEKAWEALPRRQETEQEGPCVSLLGAHGGRRLLEKVREALPARVRDDTCSGPPQAVPDGRNAPEPGTVFLNSTRAFCWSSFPACAWSR